MLGFGAPHKDPAPENHHYSTCLTALHLENGEKPHLQSWLLFDLIRAHSVGKALALGHFSNIIISNDLILQLPEVLIPVGENKRLSRKLKEKSREMICL